MEELITNRQMDDYFATFTDAYRKSNKNTHGGKARDAKQVANAAHPDVAEAFQLAGPVNDLDKPPELKQLRSRYAAICAKLKRDGEASKDITSNELNGTVHLPFYGDPNLSSRQRYRQMAETMDVLPSDNDVAKAWGSAKNTPDVARSLVKQEGFKFKRIHDDQYFVIARPAEKGVFAAPAATAAPADAPSPKDHINSSGYTEKYIRSLVLFGWMPPDNLVCELTGWSASTCSHARNVAEKKGISTERSADKCWVIVHREPPPPPPQKVELIQPKVTNPSNNGSSEASILANQLAQAFEEAITKILVNRN